MPLDAHGEAEIRRAAALASFDPAPLLAIAEVEAGGRLLVEIGGEPSPPIRFRPHVFHRRVRPELRAYAAELGLAAPRPAPLIARASRAEWALFARARRIDHEAACAACAWGFGGVSGEQALKLGFENAEALAAAACAGVASQTELLIRRLGRDLRAAIEVGNWLAYADARSREIGEQVDTESLARSLAEAALVWEHAPPRLPPPPTLGLGARGRFVRRLQRLLAKAGWPTPVDGIFDAATRAAVQAAQADLGHVRDGLSRPALWRDLESRARR